MPQQWSCVTHQEQGSGRRLRTDEPERSSVRDDGVEADGREVAPSVGLSRGSERRRRRAAAAGRILKRQQPLLTQRLEQQGNNVQEDNRAHCVPYPLIAF